MIILVNISRTKNIDVYKYFLKDFLREAPAEHEKGFF